MTFSMHLLACLASDYKDAMVPEGHPLNLTYYKMAVRISAKAAICLETAVIVTSFGSGIAYLVVGGQMAAAVIMNSGTEFGLGQTGLTIILKIIMAGALLPMCLLREVKGTTIPNAIAIGCLLYVVAFAIFKADPFGENCVDQADMYSYKSVSGVIICFPKFIFAYCCAQNLFGVANESKKFTVGRLDGTAALATVTAIIFNMVCAIFPYVTFGSDVQGNFLGNYSNDQDAATKIANIAAFLQVLPGYVLVIHPMRNALIGTAERYNLTQGKSASVIRYIAGCVVVCLTLGVAIILGDDLGIVVDLAGLLGANTMCFVIPCYLYCASRDINKHKASWYCSAAMFVMGIALYPAGLYGVIYNKLHPEIAADGSILEDAPVEA